MIYAHFFCGKNDLRAFFVAKTIYALRPESFCALKVAIWKVQTFWASGWGTSQILSGWKHRSCLSHKSPQSVFQCLQSVVQRVQQVFQLRLLQVLTTPHETPTRCSRWEEPTKVQMRTTLKAVTMTKMKNPDWLWLVIIITDKGGWKWQEGCWRLPPRRRNGGGWRAAWTRRAERAALPKSSQSCSQVGQLWVNLHMIKIYWTLVCQKLLF